MIEFIDGKLIEKNPAFVVIENGGIGYLMHISLQTFSNIKDLERVRLFAHQTFRVEATTPVGIVLYGFFQKEERQLFKLLISVSGVGNSTALLMLSSLSPDKIITAISQGDLVALKAVKGIGNKTAQRIIVDLQDKIGKETSALEFLGTAHNTRKDEALIGLTTLGFSKATAAKALEKLLSKNPDLSVELLIRDALKIL
ncbi:MAG TPA: Holliday junction branch migration protein RuvA [Bacteroidales bacterium]|nr:Holliday junction branch migration protein RuvA [Bacteroidales bacterium]